MTKTMSEGVRTFSTIGDFILRTSFFRPFLDPPPSGPGPKWAQGPSGPRAQVGPGPKCARPKWARAQVGQGPSGPGPKWAQGPSGPRAQVAPGPKWAQGPSGPRAQVGQGPSGPGPKRARAQVGEGPSGPGPKCARAQIIPPMWDDFLARPGKSSQLVQRYDLQCWKKRCDHFIAMCFGTPGGLPGSFLALGPWKCGRGTLFIAI